MTQVDLVNQRCLDLKLELLESQRGYAHHIIDDVVNNIIGLAKQWTDNQEGKPQIYELLQAIDRAVELLELKSNEISESLKNILKNVAQQTVDGQSKQNSSQEIDEDNPHSIFPPKILALCKKQKKKLDEHEEQMGIINAKLDKLEKAEKEVSKMKKQLTKLSTNQNQLEDKIISRVTKNMDERLILSSNSNTELLKDLILTETDKCKYFMGNVLTRTDSLEKSEACLSGKISRNEESVESILTKQERCTVEIEDIAKKLVVVEDRDKKFEDLQKQFDDVEEKYKIVCQMLITRLMPLEQLRKTLNERCQTRDDNIAKLQELVKEVAIMSPRIEQLEMQSSKTVVGFTAGLSDVQKIENNSVIAFYSHIYCNVGGYFNQDSGVFTAPCDGLYVVSITLMCHNCNDVLEVNILCDDALVSSKTQKTACWAISGPNIARYSDLGLIEMKTGDTLYAKVIEQGCSNSLDITIRISCFLIGR